MANLSRTPKYSILLRSLLICCLTGLNYQRENRDGKSEEGGEALEKKEMKFFSKRRLVRELLRWLAVATGGALLGFPVLWDSVWRNK